MDEDEVFFDALVWARRRLTERFTDEGELMLVWDKLCSAHALWSEHDSFLRDILGEEFTALGRVWHERMCQMRQVK